MSSKYISNKELGRFNLFYRPTTLPNPDYIMLDELPPLDVIFQDPDVFYTFVFIKYKRKDVGHWCLLIKHSHDDFEWFDCLAKPPPYQLVQRIEEYCDIHNTMVSLLRHREPLMSPDNWICGKWCMFRVMTLPKTPEEFTDKIEQIREVMQPDELVDFTVNFRI